MSDMKLVTIILPYGLDTYIVLSFLPNPKLRRLLNRFIQWAMALLPVNNQMSLVNHNCFNPLLV